MPNGSEWIFIVVIAVLLFGGTQIPRLARSLGQAQKEFKQGLKEGADDTDGAEKSDDSTS